MTVISDSESIIYGAVDESFAVAPRAAKAAARARMAELDMADAQAREAIQEREVERMEELLERDGVHGTERARVLKRQRKQHEESDVEDGAEMEPDRAWGSHASLVGGPPKRQRLLTLLSGDDTAALVP